MDGWTFAMWSVVAGCGALVYLRIVAAGAEASERSLRLLERREIRRVEERIEAEKAAKEAADQIYVAERVDQEDAA